MFIKLTQGKVAILDRRDYLRFRQYPWIAVNLHGHWYAALTTKSNRKLYMHRVIMGVMNPDIEIDHINGNTLDNRRSNLRIASKSQNQRNRYAVAGIIPYKGVRQKDKGRWYASIKVNGKSIWLGSFDHPVKAAHAYDRAARKYFGSFARLNFPRWK